MFTVSYATRHSGPTIVKKGVSVLVSPLPLKVSTTLQASLSAIGAVLVPVVVPVVLVVLVPVVSVVPGVVPADALAVALAVELALALALAVGLETIVVPVVVVVVPEVVPVVPVVVPVVVLVPVVPVVLVPVDCCPHAGNANTKRKVRATNIARKYGTHLSPLARINLAHISASAQIMQLIRQPYHGHIYGRPLEFDARTG
jgi:hypothetical protein